MTQKAADKSDEKMCCRFGRRFPTVTANSFIQRWDVQVRGNTIVATEFNCLGAGKNVDGVKYISSVTRVVCYSNLKPLKRTSMGIEIDLPASHWKSCFRGKGDLGKCSRQREESCQLLDLPA